MDSATMLDLTGKMTHLLRFPPITDPHVGISLSRFLLSSVISTGSMVANLTLFWKASEEWQKVFCFHFLLSAMVRWIVHISLNRTSSIPKSSSWSKSERTLNVTLQSSRQKEFMLDKWSSYVINGVSWLLRSDDTVRRWPQTKFRDNKQNSFVLHFHPQNKKLMMSPLSVSVCSNAAIITILIHSITHYTMNLNVSSSSLNVSNSWCGRYGDTFHVIKILFSQTLF